MVSHAKWPTRTHTVRLTREPVFHAMTQMETVLDWGASAEGLDCNEDDENVHPGLRDECDGIDNDCDDNVDEDFFPIPCGEGACQAETVVRWGRAGWL